MNNDDCKSKLAENPRNTLLFITKDNVRQYYCFMLNTVINRITTSLDFTVNNIILSPLIFYNLLLQRWNTFLIIDRYKIVPISRRDLIERGAIRKNPEGINVNTFVLSTQDKFKIQQRIEFQKGMLSRNKAILEQTKRAFNFRSQLVTLERKNDLLSRIENAKNVIERFTPDTGINITILRNTLSSQTLEDSLNQLISKFADLEVGNVDLNERVQEEEKIDGLIELLNRTGLEEPRARIDEDRRQALRLERMMENASLGGRESLPPKEAFSPKEARPIYRDNSPVRYISSDSEEEEEDEQYLEENPLEYLDYQSHVGLATEEEIARRRRNLPAVVKNYSFFDRRLQDIIDEIKNRRGEELYSLRERLDRLDNWIAENAFREETRDKLTEKVQRVREKLLRKIG